MPEPQRLTLPLRVATTEVVAIGLVAEADQLFCCSLAIRLLDSPVKADTCELLNCTGEGPTEIAAILAAISQLCSRPLELLHCERRQLSEEQIRVTVVLQAGEGERQRGGAGWAVAENNAVALTLATLRAANHAGLLKKQFRANNQKMLRKWARQTVTQIASLQTADSPAAWQQPWQQLEAEGIVLEALNRAASAAVITATNHPQPDKILRMFDTSVWLFDPSGERRESHSETDFWLAWHPGLDNDQETVDAVIASMPAAPEQDIPRIVRLFENPGSRLRFRGAVDLEDHDVLHVLLGRGLQDQDEAFVLGFAMGTAKRISWPETFLFKLLLTRIYPEPYRIPTYLQPAFDLGVQCGRETGIRQLYKQQLKSLRTLTVGEARSRLEIDMHIVRHYYRLEQQAIPHTIASQRLIV